MKSKNLSASPHCADGGQAAPAQQYTTIDVMQMELWSLPMAAAWMLWQTEDAARAACPDANGYSSRPNLLDVFTQACDPDLLPQMEGAKAQTEFWAAMLDGRIRPAGVPRDASIRVVIPAAEWLALSHIPSRNQHPEAIGTLDETRYKDVVVQRKEVLAVWPQRELPSVRGGSARDEDACEKWLVNLISLSPNKRTMTNAELKTQAKADWPNLADRQFARAKSAAILKTNAFAWMSGGAPPKEKT